MVPGMSYKELKFVSTSCKTSQESTQFTEKGQEYPTELFLGAKCPPKKIKVMKQLIAKPESERTLFEYWLMFTLSEQNNLCCIANANAKTKSSSKTGIHKCFKSW